MDINFIDLKKQYQELRASIDRNIQAVLDHGQYIMGPEVQLLEERLADYTGSRNAITCASGTEALLIALMAIGIKPGDEVITTPFTFVATAEVIALLGARPVFVDVRSDTYNIDPEQIIPAITERTRAIIPVSLYGQVANMDEINAIAEHYQLVVIEDAAQSFGATYKSRKSCNLSTIGCTSFFPSKPLGCYGDGGAIFTSDDQLAKVMHEIRVHGQSKRYHHTRIGVGGRMDTLQCAIVLAKLERFDWEIEQRQAIGARYTELLSGSVITPKVLPDRISVYGQYTVQVEQREAVQQRLQSLGVPTAVHYPLPLHLQPAYKEICTASSLPIAERLAQQVMSLPMYPDLDEQTQDYIVTAVKQAVLK